MKEDKRRTLVLPYVKGLSDNVGRASQHLDIKTTFISCNAFRKTSTFLETPIPPEKKVGVIYAIPCECGAVYIGETGQILRIQKAEHKRAVNTGDHTNALAVHSINTGHRFLWEESRIFDQEINWWKR